LEAVYLNRSGSLASLRANPLIELEHRSGSETALHVPAEEARQPRDDAVAGPVFIGTAGWNVPSRYRGEFCGAGTHLQRYAQRLNAVEINSCFHRSHRRETYERWAECVPESFRFAVKLPKSVTHECALRDCEAELDRFASEAAGLGSKLGVLLVQLPPSFVFEPDSTRRFFADLRARFEPHVDIACEPRHATWLTQEVDSFLFLESVARVAADPPRSLGNVGPGGWRGLDYYRLHGSPRMYYSNYEQDALERTRRSLQASRMRASATWCIFDNTAAHAALGNALALSSTNSR
jgi:uncharacterized protein YecE (DUF72 family)